MNPRIELVWQGLQALGARRTVARDAILDVLVGANGHLSILEIHEQVIVGLPSIELSTIYRAVLFLAEHDVVHLLAVAGQPRYGLADRPHHHAVCVHCGHVTELPPHDLPALSIAPDRFRPAQQGQTVLGVCAACAPKDAPETPTARAQSADRVGRSAPGRRARR
jgi:Fe2+ or Zn2+ uptake regulation protein